MEGMNPYPLRKLPGSDPRKALESAVSEQPGGPAFVLSGIGSLIDAKLRFAGHDTATSIPGPSEILTLAGSIAENGAHLHMSISTPDGRVIGGHVVYGNTVRTTAEVLLAPLPGWVLQREPDASTGYDELVVRRRVEE